MPACHRTLRKDPTPLVQLLEGGVTRRYPFDLQTVPFGAASEVDLPSCRPSGLRTAPSSAVAVEAAAVVRPCQPSGLQTDPSAAEAG